MTNDWQIRDSKRGGQPTYWRYIDRMCASHGMTQHVEIKTEFERTPHILDLNPDKKQETILSICQKCSKDNEKSRFKRSVESLRKTVQNKRNAFWYDNR